MSGDGQASPASAFREGCLLVILATVALTPLESHATFWDDIKAVIHKHTEPDTGSTDPEPSTAPPPAETTPSAPSDDTDGNGVVPDTSDEEENVGVDVNQAGKYLENELTSKGLYRDYISGLRSPAFVPGLGYSDYLKLGNRAYSRSDFETAIMFWGEALHLRPTSVVPYNKIAYAYNKGGDPVTALQFYLMAYNLDPSSYMTVFNVAELYHEAFLRGRCLAHFDCRIAAITLYEYSLYMNPPPKQRRQAYERALLLSGMK